MAPQERKVMELALEALEDARDNHGLHYVNEIVDLRQAIEQAQKQEPTRSQKMRDAGITRRPKTWNKEQKPVAWRAPNWGHGDDEWVYRDFDDPVLIADGKPSPNNEALYTTPPQRKPLTDEQKQLKFVKWGLIPANQSWQIQDWFYAGIAYAEAAHGIKGDA